MPDSADDLGLPALLTNTDFATVSEWIEELWRQYRGIVQDPGVCIGGKWVVDTGQVEADGRTAGFWHCISDSARGGASAKPQWTDRRTRGLRARGRVLSLTRGAMLGRTWALLDLVAAGDPRAVWWRETDWRGSHVLVADANFTMLVAMHERAHVLRLKTQYPLRSRHAALEMQNRAAASWLRGRCRRDEHEVIVDRHPMWRLERSNMNPMDSALRAAGLTM
jgi:hypothetical protein